jgi:hypothetical protein
MATQRRINPQQNPELYSYGSNEQGARNVFNERLKYDSYIFPDFLASNFIQTWTADRFYGIINHKGNSVFPNTVSLKPLQFVRDGSQNQYALNFVADAWYDFARKVRELADNNIIFRDSPWAKPYIVKAWSPIQDEYNNYMREEIYPIFADEFMTFSNNNKKVKNIHSFIERVDYFIEHIVLKAGPISMSGLIEGSYAPIYMSGLVIEIADDAYDDDFNKAYKFGDRNFSFIANLASQYGFSIDKNVPWRLVADLRNPAMLEYMLGVPIEGFVVGDNVEDLCDPVIGDAELPPLAFGYSQIPGLENVKRHVAFFQYEDENGNTKEEPGYKRYKIQEGESWIPTFDRSTQSRVFAAMFETDFVETWSLDVEFFERFLLRFYNFYIATRPEVSIQNTVPENSDCAPQTKSLRRDPVTEEHFRVLYGDRWRLKTFYAIRKAERNSTVSVRQRAYQIQQVMNIYNLTLQTSPDIAYQRALRAMQEDFIGPADTDPLTLNFVGDIVDS